MTTAYLYDTVYLEHETGWSHPESPARIKHIHRKITSASYYKKLLLIQPIVPDLRIIELIHDPNYIIRVKREIEEGTPFFDSMDTAVCPRSYMVALKAVGGCLAMCDAIMEGKAINGFCAVRPPGHHAEYDYAAGFCIFNNCAISARFLQQSYGIKKIAIIDWDVHHGNGTQHSFDQDDSILYVSLHQFPHYPGTGSSHERGTGKGKGFTLNIPMQVGSGDAEYLQAFTGKILPALDGFHPEFILISAGFDAHRSDPLSGIRLSTDCYSKMTDMLATSAAKHCASRMLAILEGGYNLDALANSVDAVMASLVKAST